MLFTDTMKVTTKMLASHRPFMRLVRWDVKPEDLFKPRFVNTQEDKHLAGETEGYMFYVDWFKEKGEPVLMVFKTAGLSSSTFAEVTDCPKELLWDVVKRKGVRNYSGMYPIDEKLEAWLKEKLGVARPGEAATRA